MRHAFLVVVLAATALVSASLEAQQSLLVSQGRVIAFCGANGTVDGDLVPGLSAGELFGGPNGFDSPMIGEDGSVFFRGQIVDAFGGTFPTGQVAYSRGYFQGASRAGLVKVLRGGDLDPSNSIPGATLQTSNGGVAFTGTPRMSLTGTILFGSSLWDVSGASITASNDTALYVGIPGYWQILAREGDAAPGAGGATYAQSFNSMTQGATSVNQAGQALFSSTLAGAGVTAANDAAWFAGIPGSVQMVFRKGDLGPGGEQISSIGFQPQMNALGQAVIDIVLLTGSGAVPVTTANDKALVLYTPGTGLAPLLREGDPSPVAGAVHGAPNGSWSNSTGPNAFNAAGELLINSNLIGAVTAGVNDVALVKVSQNGQTLVARRDDPAPGVSGARLNAIYSAGVQLDDSGRVAFQSTLVGAGIGASNDSGIWTGLPGSLVLVAREGDVAPGAGGQTFGNMIGSGLSMNASGQVLFLNGLSGGGSSLWSWDPMAGLQAIHLPGDLVEVRPGIFRTATIAATATASNGSSRPLGFANDGTIALRVSFNDYSSAIMTVRIGSLSGFPAKISAQTGGVHELRLNAGPAQAGRIYVVAGSASGVAPGTQIGIFNVPLNADWYTQYTLDLANVGPFVNTVGLLDADGRATAQIVLPSLIGFDGAVVHHAFAVLDNAGQISFASEPASLEITP
jgi:hypothetical protein